MSFSDKGILEINSVIHKKKIGFFYADNSLKSYYDKYYDILHTIAVILGQC